ncbi:DNA mismatch repair endonuclease MutL [Oceanotoga sp. DSM 15011]|uniref:DNA mismatch repair endonuclease MutL n=1 Tax=Oceanotoga sp. DSM 15011 TaxID=2984951 RepID=UPI0021F3D3C6|nr:DNA mismatch repair endonuclease MutL [Oceanotoga sp. DSM 15011]UYP00726.1 DNA mismatch repair endonuclease MutL [Oceanotoga sp. DSM 15011]
MKIKRLSDDIIMKIAAGEVITGTYAVVKELVENSIDSDSNDIKISIKDGGKTYIKVEDNGFGMNEENILAAVQPHTTSKLNQLNDLYALNTYGFRGEALSSICQVSRMTIISKEEDEKLGTKIDFIAGKKVNIEKVPIKNNSGTIIEVYDLFFNVPARRKFLKSSSAESRNVTEIVEKFIASSNISYSYYRNDKMIYNVQKDMTLENKLNIIYPEWKKDGFISVNRDDGWIKVKGMISNPKYTRNNRTGQNFFVNNRYIKSGAIFTVFEAGYAHMLEKGRHPYGFLFVEISPDEVDVNVHPQKLEVKFSDNTSVMNIIKGAIRDSLNEQTKFEINFVEKSFNDQNEINNYYIKEEKSPNEKIEKSYNKEYILNENIPNKKNIEYVEENNDNSFEYKKKIDNYNNKINYDIKKEKLYNFDKLSENKNYEIKNENNINYNIRIIGISNQRYIIAESLEKLFLIDFHAAHERVIFEKLKEQFINEGKINKKMILIPEIIQFDNITYEIIKENIVYFDKMGIGLEILEENKIKINSTPGNMKVKDINSLILDMANLIRLKGIDSIDNIYDDTIATMSCRAAVKTGDDFLGADKLLEDIKKYNLLTCPHGRPITMEINFSKIDSYFKRT